MLPATLELCCFVNCSSVAIPSTLNPAAPPKDTAGKETQKEIQWMQVSGSKQAFEGAAGKETGLNRWRSPRC